MTEKEFITRAVTLFGQLLEPHGFTNRGSRRATFYRVMQSSVVHFIWAECNSRGTTFLVRVFPSSPEIDPLFDRQFPDDLGIPTDIESGLGTSGVGSRYANFRCRTEEGLSRVFRTEVAPLLGQFAIPYLDRFRTVADMIPAIKHSFFLGFALSSVGRTNEAVPILRSEMDRVSKIDPDSEETKIVLRKINEVLLSSA